MLTSFLLMSLVAQAIDAAHAHLITTYTSPMFALSQPLWLNAAAVVATGISLIWNFIGYRVFVFKNS